MEKRNELSQIKDFANTIKWLGQSTVKIDYKEITIYIDPFQLKSKDSADLILITHDHFDHLSLDDIRKISKPDTKFIIAKACEKSLREAGYSNLQTVFPGEKINFKELVIRTVPAYNIVKNFHKKESDYLGYIINFDGIKVYHTGDTERISEMKEVDCDIILLPLGQTYTMNSVEEAAEAVKDTKAIIAIPIHYGLYEGTLEDALKFMAILERSNNQIITLTT